MKTKFTLLGGAALLALAGMSTATTVQAKEVWGKGAPEFTDPDGNIKFKVRGRVQEDIVSWQQDGPSVTTAGGVPTFNALDKSGFQTRMRRFRLGVEGAYSSNLKYKAEVTLSGSGTPQVQYEDVYLEWVASPLFSVVVGHQDFGNSLERSTSSRFITNMERNLGDQAWGFGRVMGIGLMTQNDLWGGQLFLNGDSLNNSDPVSNAGGAVVQGSVQNEGQNDEAWGINARAFLTPIKTPDKLVYLGATFRHREARDEDFNNNGAGLGSGTQGTKGFRYRARPETNIGDRLVDTGSTLYFNQDDLWLIDAAAAFGPAYIQGEYSKLSADGYTTAAVVPSAATKLSGDFSTFFVQGGWFLTGESRAGTWKNDRFDRITPNNPLSEGGWGAWELRARYDSIDLDDPNAVAAKSIDGGKMDAWTVGVNWTPVKNIRLMGEYVNASVDDRTITRVGGFTTANPNADFDAVQFRVQFDW